MQQNVWIKSSESTAANNCVEVLWDGEKVHVRNSKTPDAGSLTFTIGEWTAFQGGVDKGEFNIA